MSIDRLYRRASGLLVPTMGFADNGGMGAWQLGCCCEAGDLDGCCPEGSTPANPPTALGVSLAGWSDGNCYCSSINGGYELPSVGGCAYYLAPLVVGCTVGSRIGHMQGSIQYSGGMVTVHAKVHYHLFLNTRIEANYSGTFAGANCSRFTDKALTDIGFTWNLDCGAPIGTCTVSSVG